MIFRQLFDSVSCTYTYLLGSRAGGEALIIDPVVERVDRYIQLLEELDLQLVKAVDTHVHADHITGLGALRDRTRCITVMGKASKVDVVSMRVDDGDTIDIETISLRVIHTPGIRMIRTVSSYRTASSPGTPCSSGAPEGPTSNTATPMPHTIPCSTSCSPCPTRRWSTPATTTRARPSAPSARKGPLTRVFRSARPRSTPRSWTT